ncbi:hypothetical protein M9H77_16522 [Catharanthus roseus]|uniref:Uncharacterized protein n=1 Tax=Catharanthus roseus TaxID=4058 RepID=A0ACC0B205_CATRO|nr:hypothetical protein M9H77_16522 [Catharanthus roseus]
MGVRLFHNRALVWCLAGFDYEMPELSSNDLVMGSGLCPWSPTKSPQHRHVDSLSVRAHELETNQELPAPSSSTPDPHNIPEILDLVLEGFDEEKKHLEAQTQALRDY